MPPKTGSMIAIAIFVTVGFSAEAAVFRLSSEIQGQFVEERYAFPSISMICVEQPSDWKAKIDISPIHLMSNGPAPEDVSCMSPFMKRRKRGQNENRRDAGSLPAYRRDDRAVEYGQRGGERREESPVGPGRAPLSSGDRRELQPLPRCRHCGTAIGYQQKKCHACDEELSRL